MDDDESEGAFFKNFEEMFGMGGASFGMAFDIFSDFDAFAEVLETDTRFMKKVAKGLGSNYRNVGKRRKQPKGGASHFDDIFSFLMMPGMMKGAKGNKKGKTSKKK